MNFVVIVIIIAFAGVISNQYSGLQQMRKLQSSLDSINRKLDRITKEKLHDND
ncbi:hypothetical protein JJQ72_01500 [Paenibacillus sp. F411]|uniref:hypothetical protein n=1 Tax=Paenibacillus sp. F411 TaxID=2820239 RepID=UPI001AAEF687|nr:hypothetical protein [Paenibacillus sp. F411]MBO2942659.1 hypothetical protein [Paenibacillus sp. F411]